MIQLVQDWRPMWAWIEAGLREVIERTGATWLPADVYGELKSGSSVLATVGDDAGFIVMKRLQDYDCTVLFVWVLWGPNALAPMDKEAHEALREIARQAGCRKIQMRSPRRGWERVGWRERETIYEQEL